MKVSVELPLAFEDSSGERFVTGSIAVVIEEVFLNAARCLTNLASKSIQRQLRTGKMRLRGINLKQLTIISTCLGKFRLQSRMARTGNMRASNDMFIGRHVLKITRLEKALKMSNDFKEFYEHVHVYIVTQGTCCMINKSGFNIRNFKSYSQRSFGHAFKSA